MGVYSCGLLVDTDSQRTFIRKDISQQLRLSCAVTEEMDVFTFGDSKHPRYYQCRRINVTLCGRMEPIDINLEALAIPEVCTANGPTLEPSVIAMKRGSNLAFAYAPQGDQPQDSMLRRFDRLRPQMERCDLACQAFHRHPVRSCDHI
ncbi:hypothetical protein MRX96_009988 [Rhipicephalus microplus]